MMCLSNNFKNHGLFSQLLFIFCVVFKMSGASTPTAATPTASLRLSLGSKDGSYPSSQNRLYNSIVNVVLVYGVDETFRALDINEEGVSCDVIFRVICCHGNHV